MNKRYKTYFHLTCLTLYLFIFFLLYRHLTDQSFDKNKGSYDCQAVFTVENADLKMPAVANISVRDNKGIILFGGPVYRNNLYIGSVSRRVEFDYTEEYSCTVFKHCKTIKFEKDDVDNNIEKKILPGFLTTSDAVSHFRIHKLKDGVLFKKDNVPMFFCSYR